MTHIYRWHRTQFGPLNVGLQTRFNAPCRVVVEAKRPATSRLIEFADGARFVVPRHAVRSLP